MKTNSKKPSAQDYHTDRAAFLNDLPSISYSDLLPNHDGTSWFVKSENGPFHEVLQHREGKDVARSLDVNDVVLLRSGSILGDGSRYFKYNCEGQKVFLTPVYQPVPDAVITTLTESSSTGILESGRSDETSSETDAEPRVS